MRYKASPHHPKNKQYPQCCRQALVIVSLCHISWKSPR